MRTSEDYTNRHAGRWTGSWTHLRTTKKLPHPGGAILFLKLRADGNVMYRLAPSRVVRVVAAWKLLQGCSSRFDLAIDLKLKHHTHVCVHCLLFRHKNQVGTAMLSAGPCWSVFRGIFAFPALTVAVLCPSFPKPFMYPLYIISRWSKRKPDQSLRNMHTSILMRPICPSLLPRMIEADRHTHEHRNTEICTESRHRDIYRYIRNK